MQLGFQTVIIDPVVVDRKSGKVVAGLIGFHSAKAAIKHGNKSVMVHAIFADDVQGYFTAGWPALEAQVSRLSITERRHFLKALLLNQAPCVAHDRGRSAAKSMGLSVRSLKRTRAKARSEQNSSPAATTNATPEAGAAPDAPEAGQEPDADHMPPVKDESAPSESDVSAEAPSAAETPPASS